MFECSAGFDPVLYCGCVLFLLHAVLQLLRQLQHKLQLLKIYIIHERLENPDQHLLILGSEYFLRERQKVTWRVAWVAESEATSCRRDRSVSDISLENVVILLILPK